jgi:hypothetical protein
MGGGSNGKGKTALLDEPFKSSFREVFDFSDSFLSEIGDASMEMESELSRECLFVELQIVFVNPLFEHKNESIGHWSGKDWPAHFNIAHFAERRRAWRRRLCHRATESPATENVPLGDSSESLEANELIASRVRNPDVLYGGVHSSRLRK